MALLKRIFTWWNGATLGTTLWSAPNGGAVGEDEFGDRYFESRKANFFGRTRRWVIYNGPNDASRVPPEWHGWLHHQIEALPSQALPPKRDWQKPASPNLTGTHAAYRPSGALEAGGVRQAATGDYEAWSPK